MGSQQDMNRQMEPGSSGYTAGTESRLQPPAAQATQSSQSGVSRPGMQAPSPEAGHQDIAQVIRQLNDVRCLYDEARTKLTELQVRLDRALAERDATMQELFESNRYSGALTVERQVLLERVAGAEAQQHMLRDHLAEAQARKHVLQNYLDAVYASTSWKFAWPVRAAKRLLQGRRP